MRGFDRGLLGRTLVALRRRRPRGAPALPVPPDELIRHSGWTPGTDLVERYLRDGRPMAELLTELVSDTPGRLRVLDFGCGAGKTLRHFAGRTDRFELFGADTDGPSIEWLRANLSTHGSFAQLSPEPALPYPDEYFDLIYAVSVFTHLAEHWAQWLLELRRVLAPGGRLAVTVLGEAMIEIERGGAWDADEIGMNVLRRGQDWAGGGPTVFLSHWWIREHWGRAFEIAEIREDRNADGSRVAGTHDLVIMRRGGGPAPSAAELERLNGDDPREVRALQRNIEQLHADDAHLRELLAAARARGDAEHDQRVELTRRLEAAQAELDRLRAAGPPAPAEANH